MLPLRKTVLLGVALTATLAGCGGSPVKAQQEADSASIHEVLHELQAAGRAGDGDRICRHIFTPKLSDSVTVSSPSGSCATEVRRKLFSPRTRFTIQDVTVTDPANGTATVEEANGNTSNVFFVKQSGRWRIRGVQAG